MLRPNQIFPPVEHPQPNSVKTSEHLRTELYEFIRTDSAVFDFLQETSLDGLWYWDPQYPEQAWVNAAFWHTLGYSPEQVTTQALNCQSVLHPDDLAELRAQVAALPEAGDKIDQVLRASHQDGSIVWLRCRGLLCPTEAGPSRLLSTLRNITQEKQQSDYARKVESHYSLLLDNQSVYIIRTDVEGNYTYVNDLFYERFGLDNKIIGTSSLESIIEEDRPKCVETVMKCFAEPEVPHQVILRKPYRDNAVKSNHWEFKGIVGEKGEVVEILCVGYDITLLVENLQRSQHLLDVTSQQNIRLQNFAYIISHNIRSHSANLTSLVQLLAEAQSAEHKDMFLQMLKTSTDKLADTILNLNDIITVNSNFNKPREPRVLKAEIDKTLEVLSALIRQHQIVVSVQVPEQLVVQVVPAYLDSILLNLISNAIKYHAPDRPAHIQLEAHLEPGYVVLSVQDNGLGLDLVKNGTKLFGMYKTFHNNEDARGVGLFITKNQIEAMLGHIEVESEVGVGSTFKVYFNENA